MENVKEAEKKAEQTKVITEDAPSTKEGIEKQPQIDTKVEADKREKLAANPLGIVEPASAVIVPTAAPNVATDKGKPHKERILAFLESRKGQGTIKLNDFLKSLYPLPKGLEVPQHQSQGNLRKLRQDLRELQQEGKISFTNDSFEQLGNPHFPDQATGKTYYKNIMDTPIEIVS